MKDHWKTISDGSNTILSNIERTRTSFFEHRKNTNVFIYWWSNSNTLFLASNDRTSNFEPNRAFTRFTKSLIELTQTPFFQTSNELERVHLLVTELKHPICGFKRSNIELQTLFDPSLITVRKNTFQYNSGVCISSNCIPKSVCGKIANSPHYPGLFQWMLVQFGDHYTETIDLCVDEQMKYNGQPRYYQYD